jgi:hypothetical protein
MKAIFCIIFIFLFGGASFGQNKVADSSEAIHKRLIGDWMFVKGKQKGIMNINGDTITFSNPQDENHKKEIFTISTQCSNPIFTDMGDEGMGYYLKYYVLIHGKKVYNYMEVKSVNDRTLCLIADDVELSNYILQRVVPEEKAMSSK